MKNKFLHPSSAWAATALIVLTLSSNEGFGTEGAHSIERPITTFSIAGFDPETGDLGVAVQSKFFNVGSVVPWAKANVGAIATQSYANPAYGPDGLRLLEEGKSAREVVEQLTAADEGREKRQLGVVDANGNSANFTGSECNGWAGHFKGPNVAIQGNLLAGDEVVTAMAEAFGRAKDAREEEDSELADWLMAALQAGQEAGGDKRGKQSAALLVVRENGGFAGANDRYIDLHVEDHPEPIQELARLLQMHKQFFRNAHRRIPERKRPSPPDQKPKAENQAEGGADGEEIAEASRIFRDHVAPVFLARCVACHGKEKAKGGYRLDTLDALMTPGGSDKPPVIVGQAGESRLYQLITAEDELDRMPQEGDPLTPGEVDWIREWIQKGAVLPDTNGARTLASFVERQHPPPPSPLPASFPVKALSFLPEGGLAASGYHHVAIWNVESELSPRILENVMQQPLSLSHDPEGNLLLVAGGAPGQYGEAALYHLETGRRIRILGRYPDVALATAWSSDGETIAVAGSDRTIHLYSLSQRTERLAIQQHADWVTDICFNGEGTRIASASRDRSARLYEVATGELLANYTEHEDWVLAVTFLGGGEGIASAGRDRTVHLWNPENGDRRDVVRSLGVEILRLAGDDERIFAALADGRVVEISLGSTEAVHTIGERGEWIHSLAWEKRTGRLAAGDHRGRIRIWDMSDSGAPPAELALLDESPH